MTSLKRGKRSTRIWTECWPILETQRTISIQDLRIFKSWNVWSCSQKPSSKSSRRVSSNCEKYQKLAIRENALEIKQLHESREDPKREIHEWTRRTNLETSYRRDLSSTGQQWTKVSFMITHSTVLPKQMKRPSRNSCFSTRSRVSRTWFLLTTTHSISGSLHLLLARTDRSHPATSIEKAWWSLLNNVSGEPSRGAMKTIMAIRERTRPKTSRTGFKRRRKTNETRSWVRSGWHWEVPSKSIQSS